MRRKSRFITLGLLLLLSCRASAQFIDFPAGYSNLPDTPLKGPIHTVLSTRQRGETTFGSSMQVYDEKGRISESSSSQAGIEQHSGRLMRLGGKTIYLYDKSGKLYRRNNFDPDSNPTGYSLLKYDEKGRLIEETLFGANDQYGGYWRYSYLTNTREVEVTWQFIYGANDKGQPMRSILTYDEKNRWTSRKMFLVGGPDFTTFEYDKEGNFIKDRHATWWHGYTYKFDKYGNWIERIVSYSQDDGKYDSPNYENSYRIITYYPDREVKPK